MVVTAGVLGDEVDAAIKLLILTGEGIGGISAIIWLPSIIAEDAKNKVDKLVEEYNKRLKDDLGIE